MLIIAFGGSQRAAAAQVVLAPDQGERAAQRAGVWERAEIAGAVLLLEAGEREARNGVVEVNLQHEEPFVVAKTDIVPGMKFFDQFAFEQEGFGLAADEVKIKIRNRFEQSFEFEIPTHSAG